MIVVSKVKSAEQPYQDAWKFVKLVANLVTVEEEEGLDLHEAVTRAYQCYEGLETVEALIHRARSICEKHDVE